MIVRHLRSLALAVDLPAGLGIGAGLLLPVIAAVSFSTYTIAVTPLWLEMLRQIGLLWLVGEAILIAIAYRRGFEIRLLWRLLPRWSQVALAIFLSTFWISSALVSSYPGFSMMLSFGWIVHLLFGAALFDLSRSVTEPRLIKVWWGFVGGLVALAVLITIHFLWLPEALRGHEQQIDWALIVPGFISARLFGAWAGAIFAFMVGVAWLSNEPAKRQHVIYAATALAFASMMWTTTRAAMLASVCVLLVAWLIAGRPASRGFAMILPLYLIGAGMAVLPLQPHDDPAFTFMEASNFGSADQVASGRLTIWALALKATVLHPWLGSGAGSSWWLVTICGTYTHHVQPHNALVQFLLNWGVLPTLAAVILLAGATWHAHDAARRCRSLVPFVLMLDSLLVMSMFDGMFHFAQFIMLIVGCLSICLARSSRITDGRTPVDMQGRLVA